VQRRFARAKRYGVPGLLAMLLLPLLVACASSPGPPSPTRELLPVPAGPLGELPARLAGLPSAEVNRGEGVARESRRFYRTDVTLTEAVVAHYRNEDGLATLWVARTETADSASSIVETFIADVRAGRTLYTLVETSPVDGVTVFVLEGQRRLQYLFSAGDRVILLDVFPTWAEDALQGLLMALP